MDITNDTRRVALAMAELILLYVASFLSGCASVQDLLQSVRTLRTII
jgi:hypothetical protein